MRTRFRSRQRRSDRRWRRLTTRAMLLGTLAAAVSTVAIAQPTETGPSVTLVFDGSGSMWGAVPDGSGAKFEVARRALNRALANDDTARGRLGLVGFGLTTRGTCARVETAFAPVPGGRQQVAQTLEGMNPRGRGPVGAALEAAAETLRNQPPPRRILLVHDDDDNCGAQTCEIAQALKARLPDLTINVLTLARPAATPIAGCLGALTGGRVIQTLDASEIETASSELVRASFAPIEPTIAPPAPTAATQPQAPAVSPAGITTSPGPTGLDLAANLADSGPRATLPLRWTVIPTAGERTATFRTGATTSLDLAPGLYDVLVEVGPTTVQNQVTVEENTRTRLVTDLNSAALTFAARLGNGGEVLPFADVEVRQRDASPNTPPLSLATTDAGPLVLPQGAYLATGRKGLLSETIELDVVAGAVQAIDFQLAGARVTASYAQTSDAPPTTIDIYVDGPDQSASSPPIASALGPTATFYVPAGAYVLRARAGDTEITRLVNVAAGQTLDLSLATRLGRIRLETRLEGQSAPMSGRVQYEIQALGPGSPEPIRLFDGSEVLRLPFGRYRVSSFVEESGTTASRDIEITSDELQSITIVHQQGRLELAYARTGSRDLLAAASVDWRVEQIDGPRTWTGLGRETATLLPPGRYTVIANGDRSQARAIEVRSGEVSVVTFEETAEQAEQ